MFAFDLGDIAKIRCFEAIYLFLRSGRRHQPLGQDWTERSTI